MHGIENFKSYFCIISNQDFIMSSNRKHILIAGGTGFIGKALSAVLASKGYEVSLLTRDISKPSSFPMFYWNPDQGNIDIKALENVDLVINLAGENISSGRWTKNKKSRILNSRVKSSKLLFDTIKAMKSKPELYISSSAVGYYGTYTSDKIFIEDDLAGNDFLAGVCKDWEENALKFQTLGIRTVVLRTGVVFGSGGGAFPKMTLSLKFHVLGSIGNGKQWIPWVHLEDLIGMYLFAIENKELSGVLNAVSPCPVQMSDFVKQIVSLKSNIIEIPALPSFLINIIFGEMSSILLFGSRVSPDKIISKGFQFKNDKLKLALDNLMPGK
jgi:uncharacterized protein